jgi:signal transduction histidine kinase
LVFASALLYAKGTARTTAVVYFLVPLMSASHMAGIVGWTVQVALTLTTAAVAMYFVGAPVIPNSPDTRSITTLVATRIIALLASAWVLRIYRDSTKQYLESLMNGTLSGITILNIDGSIRRWNRVHENRFAPLGAQRLRERRLPCYYVFHSQTRPCTWCALNWNPVYARDGSTPQTFSGTTIEKHRIDTDALHQKIVDGSNWTISNQLLAGNDHKERFHLFHIYFGLFFENGKPTGIVESVSEITKAVLEMPFLLPPSRGDCATGVLPPGPPREDVIYVPEGLPAISVLRASDLAVLEMNNAKLARCQHGRPRPVSKSDLLNRPCTEAYNRPLEKGNCTDCAAKRAALGIPAKGIADFPGKTLVTAVPVFGPDGNVRAVFEFIDPIDELVEMEESVRAFGQYVNDGEQLIVEGQRRLQKMARADRCVIIELGEVPGEVTIRSDGGVSGWTKRTVREKSFPLVSQMLREKVVRRVSDLSQELEGDPLLRLVSAKHKIGPAVFLPVTPPQGDVVAIAALERFRGRSEFNEETIMRCQVLGSHLAVLIARTRDFQRREQLIEVMRRTADVLGADASLRVLIEGTQGLFPLQVNLTGYLIRGYDATRELIPVVVTKRKGEPPTGRAPNSESRSARIVVDDLVRPLLEAGQLATVSADAAGARFVSRRDTRILLVQPFAYGQRPLGCIVAESPECDAQTAFPASLRLLVSLVSNYASIVCGRSDLLRACMSMYEHDLGKPLEEALAAVEMCLRKQSSEDFTEIRERLVRKRDDLLAARRAWDVRISGPGALELSSTDAGDIVQEGQTYFEREYKGHKVTSSIGPGVSALYCDRICMEACVRELMRNAGKFSKAGTTVFLTVQRDEGGG